MEDGVERRMAADYAAGYERDPSKLVGLTPQVVRSFVQQGYGGMEYGPDGLPIIQPDVSVGFSPGDDARRSIEGTSE